MEKINEYMRSKDLKLKDDGIEPDLICNICELIMDKSTVSMCGCRFCTRCIEPYFIDDTMECPNCTSILNTEGDVGISFDLEFKIRKLMITCPNSYCDTKLCIKEMSNHLRVCSNNSNERGLNNSASEHTLESSDGQADSNDELNKYLGMIINNLEISNNEKMEKIYRLEREIDEIKAENLSSMLTLENQIRVLVTDNNNQAEKIHLLEMENSDLKRGLERQLEINDISKREIAKLKADMDDRRRERCEIIRELNSIEKLRKINIADVSSKKNGSKIYSDAFNLNGYTFMIQYCYHIDGNIWFYLKLAEGEKDAGLEWPLKNKMELKVLKNREAMGHDGNYIAVFSWFTSTNKESYNRPGQHAGRITESWIEIPAHWVLRCDSVSLILTMYPL